jgi:hypothetical protein
MVREKRKTGFFSAACGVALTEGLIVFPIIVVALAVCVEFTYVMFQWNSAAKAMQLGVRKLIVSDPVSDPLAADFNIVFASDPALAGELIPADSSVRLVCGAGAAACDANKMDRLVNGGGAGSVWPGLKAYYPSIEISHIRVTYERSGLGYHGRPAGPVVTVRLDMVAGPIDVPFLGGLLNIAGFTFPPFTVTATSEDMQSCPGGCGP